MMSDDPVTDDQIILLETGGHPRVEHLRSRLDVIYRADGHSATESVPVEDHGSHHTVTFPPWWVGPIWVALDAPDVEAAGQVTLRWTPWEKNLRLCGGTTVSARKDTGPWPPPQVHPPPGWTVDAGIGRHPSAADINQDWHAIAGSSARRIFNDYAPVYLQLFNRSKGEMLDAIRRHV